MTDSALRCEACPSFEARRVQVQHPRRAYPDTYRLCRPCETQARQALTPAVEAPARSASSASVDGPEASTPSTEVTMTHSKPQCILDGCTRRQNCRGLCRPHYDDHRNAGTLDQVALPAKGPGRSQGGQPCTYVMPRGKNKGKRCGRRTTGTAHGKPVCGSHRRVVLAQAAKPKPEPTAGAWPSQDLIAELNLSPVAGDADVLAAVRAVRARLNKREGELIQARADLADAQAQLAAVAAVVADPVPGLQRHSVADFDAWLAALREGVIQLRTERDEAGGELQEAARALERLPLDEHTEASSVSARAALATLAALELDGFTRDLAIAWGMTGPCTGDLRAKAREREQLIAELREDLHAAIRELDARRQTRPSLRPATANLLGALRDLHALRAWLRDGETAEVCELVAKAAVHAHAVEVWCDRGCPDAPESAELEGTP